MPAGPIGLKSAAYDPLLIKRADYRKHGNEHFPMHTTYFGDDLYIGSRKYFIRP